MSHKFQPISTVRTHLVNQSGVVPEALNFTEDTEKVWARVAGLVSMTDEMNKLPVKLQLVIC